MIEKKTIDDHERDFHTPMPCQYCNEPQEKFQLKDHIENCKKRPKLCPYCELELEYDQYMEHIIICGSRTEQCPHCEKYIRRADLLIHQESSCSLSIGNDIPNPVFINSSQKPTSNHNEGSSLEEEYKSAMIYDKKAIKESLKDYG